VEEGEINDEAGEEVLMEDMDYSGSNQRRGLQEKHGLNCHQKRN
jgi:hypothetical protein